MTWERRRHKGLAWALLAALLMVLGNGVWRYTAGGVPLGQDLLGVVLRVVVVGIIVLAYLRSGGSTTASRDGLVVHDGVRRREVAPAQVARIVEDPNRGGALVRLTTGGHLELPGVALTDIPAVRRQLRKG